MRILHVTAQKPHSTGSGVYLTELVNALCVSGHVNGVIAGVYAEDKVSFSDKVSFYPVYYRSPALPFPICGMSDEMPYDSTLYRSMTDEMVENFEHAFGSVLVQAVEEFKPDLIFCHHLYLLTALVRRLFPDTKVWGMCHGSDLRQLATNPLRREEICAEIAALDRICCLHQQQKQQILAVFNVPESKVCVVGTGFNDRIFYDRGLRCKHSELRLIYAGKISEKKGVYSLISALDGLGLGREDFSLCLAGGWNNEEQLERARQAIARSAWNVSLPGRLSQEQLALEYSKADVFILPSFYEGLPLVLAEAMACGARVVCTDLPGIRQWLDATVPEHRVIFVSPPELVDTDTPLPESLPRFEQELAAAILKAASLPPASIDMSALSWQGVAKRIFE